jgi:farnesyl diphosphate synthase
MVSILGLDRARDQAVHLAEQAAAHLESFGERADLLGALAHFTVTRKS